MMMLSKTLSGVARWVAMRPYFEVSHSSTHLLLAEHHGVFWAKTSMAYAYDRKNNWKMTGKWQREGEIKAPIKHTISCHYDCTIAENP
ncbi:hypothetical protein H5A22_11115 [Pectobacterium brasiliense]|nr:hypothetical protein [Pectobacterium brasiliense]MBN3169847.1 hypothetical protein [Pectobacterium brasiliense]